MATTSVFVLDISVFIKHETKLEHTDFFVPAGAGAEAVRVTMPMVVVDQRDRLKEVRDKRVRWRAGYSLAVLDRLHWLLDSNERLGRVKVEVLFDNPGHARQPDEGDERADRALAVHTIVAASMQLVTYDTGMSMRAKWANLPVLKLRADADAGAGSEPETR